MAEALDLLRYRSEEVEEAQLDTLQLASHLIEVCENEGWVCDIVEGPELWKRTISDAGGWLNPGFDPDKSDVTEANCVSIAIRDAKGDFVACNALRLFVTDSFKFIMGRGDLFYGPTTTRLLNGMPLCLDNDYRDISGRIGYSGGTLVAERYQGRRIGVLTTRLVRLLGERLYRADHHTGLIFQNRPDDPWPKNPYDFARCRSCMPYMRIPDRHQDQPLLLVDISREEFLSQVRRNVRQLVGKGHKTLDDLALLAP